MSDELINEWIAAKMREDVLAGIAGPTTQPASPSSGPSLPDLDQIYERFRLVQYPLALWIVNLPDVWNSINQWMIQVSGRTIHAHNAGFGVPILSWISSAAPEDLAWLRSQRALFLRDAEPGVYLQMNRPLHVRFAVTATDDRCRIIAEQIAWTYRESPLNWS